MKRLKFKKKANNTKTQRNYGVQTSIPVKLEYFKKLIQAKEKNFLRKRLYFSNKHSKVDTDIVSSETGGILFKNESTVNTFNK